MLTQTIDTISKVVKHRNSGMVVIKGCEERGSGGVVKEYGDSDLQDDTVLDICNNNVNILNTTQMYT